MNTASALWETVFLPEKQPSGLTQRLPVNFPDFRMQDSADLNTILQRIRKDFQVEFEPAEVDGRVFQVLRIDNMQSHLDKLIRGKAIVEPLRDLPLWAKSWPAAMILGRFLRKFQPGGKTLLELGAGMGMLSLVASGYGFEQILATDINPQAVDFITANILRNNLADIIKARCLDVSGSNLPQTKEFDFIAASELLYLDDLHRPILKFLARHLAPTGKAFFCTDIARLKPHFNKLAGKSFQLEEGHIGLKATDGERHIFNLTILSRK